VTSTQIASARAEAVTAEILELAGQRRIARFQLAGGKHHGSITEAGGDVVCRAIRVASDQGIPLVGVLDTSGADIVEGVAALHAWGRIARALHDASGVVPTIVVVDGPCLSGPALLLGIVDVVVMTDAAFAYVSGPDSVADFTGETVSRNDLGGPEMHATQSGLCTLRAPSQADAWALVERLLGYLPDNNLDAPPPAVTHDAPDRASARAATVVPVRTAAPYDVRDVIADVLDAETFLELTPRWASNMVTGLAYLDGRSVGIVANQPCVRAGSIDIDASRKAARFVQWCDAFGLPIVTFVDTPGFEPGRALEWRGMIRLGAALVHAYAEATVPRLCIVLRKAYGGAYIVMDSRSLANDWCAAWPTAQIAVMGARGAVGILARNELAAIEDPAKRARIEHDRIAEYEARFATPDEAAARGYVDDVIHPNDTRVAIIRALARLETKREQPPSRRHSNTPL